MNKNLLLAFLGIVLFSSALSSCEVIGGIFKAGVWTGILLIVVVVALILWLVSRGRK